MQIFELPHLYKVAFYDMVDISSNVMTRDCCNSVDMSDIVFNSVNMSDIVLY